MPLAQQGAEGCGVKGSGSVCCAGAGNGGRLNG